MNPDRWRTAQQTNLTSPSKSTGYFAFTSFKDNQMTMAIDKNGRNIRSDGRPRTNNVLRKSVYFPDEVLAAMHMGFEWEGGLSQRVATIVMNYDLLFDDLKPDLTLRDWADVFAAMDVEGDYDNPISLLAHIDKHLRNPEWDLAEDMIEALLGKLQALTPSEWMMINEAHYRFTIARKTMSFVAAVESVVG